MLSQRDAIVRLLQDDDPETVSLVKEQLAENGVEMIPHLKELMLHDNAKVSNHAHDILSAVESRQASGEFTLLCHFFPEQGNLEHACWLLARALIAGIETDNYQHKLDVWGRKLALKVSGAISCRERVMMLADFMSTQLSFRGNQDDYYNTQNSLLPSVIDTRLGIPISLTVLYMFIGARAGIKVDGVNLPGHFIARHGDTFFDPFHRGKILLPSDYEAILEKQDIPVNSAFLAPASSRTILCRVLSNLLFLYEEGEDYVRHARVAGWLKGLERRNA